MKKLFSPLSFAVLLCLLLPRSSQGVDPGIGNNNPTGATGEYNGSITTGGSYDPYTGNAKRFVDDLTVTGSIGAYPLKWTRILNTRGFSGPFGDGGGWNHNYSWSLSIRPIPGPNPPPCNAPPEPPAGTVAYPDGREAMFNREVDSNGVETWSQAHGLEPIGDRLVHMGGTNYDLKLKDGGRVEFRTVNGLARAAQYIVDPYGQRTTLEYVTRSMVSPPYLLYLSLEKITEPAGRYLQIYRRDEILPPYRDVTLIDHVTAYGGPQMPAIETVSYGYEVEYVNGPVNVRFFNLIHANYDDGEQATYAYTDPGLVTGSLWSLGAGNVETCNDVRYAGAMSKIKYEYVPAGYSVCGGAARGQIKAERNLTTNTLVSQVTYPSPPCSGNSELLKRTETRADNATRKFEYSQSGDLERYTDFAYLPVDYHWSTITLDDAEDPNHYCRIVTPDALPAHRAKTEIESDVGALMAVIHFNGSRMKYTYSDPNNPHHLASRADENDKPTYYDRDSANRVWQVRYPDNGVETFTYNNNPFGLVYEHLMTSGGTEVFEYDSRGLKTSYTPPSTLSDPERHKTRYFYYGGPSGPGEAPDSLGPMRPDLMDRLMRVIDPRDNSTWYEYNGRGQVTRVTHSGGTFTRSFYYRDGTVQRTEDELGHKTEYLYDEYKRVTQVKNHLNEQTNTSYDPPNGHGPFSHTTLSIYHITSHMGKVTEYDYDANFRRSRMTVAPGTEDAATTNYVTYDAVGNLRRVEDPRHKPTIYEYDDRNRRSSLTDPLNHRTEWLYDNAGNMTQEKRADLKIRTWDLYDAMNRIKHTTGFLGTQEQTSYGYDLAGNLTMVTDANNRVYTAIYDEQNRKYNASYPIDATGQSRWESWRFDIAGNLLWYKNPTFQFKHYEHDSRNRQRRSYWNSSHTDTTPDWSVGPEIRTTPDAAGRLTEVHTNGGETIVAYGYDHANRKIWEDQKLAGWPTRRVETNPDQDGARATLSVTGVPDGYSFAYEYTQRRQLRHIKRGGSPYFEYTHDVNGNLTKRQRMAQGQGRDSTNFLHDDINRVTLCEQTGPNGNPFARSNYNDYDLVNNLKSISREEDGNKGELFDYDDANQLRSVSYKADIAPHPPGPGGAAVAVVEMDEEREAVAALEADPVREPQAEFIGVNMPAGPHTVTYDNDAINRKSMTSNGAVTHYERNALNQYTAVTGQGSLSYDARFNLSGYIGWAYAYDAEKRLISVQGNGAGAVFVYDGLGRCVKRTIDGVTTVFTYDEWKPIVEWKWENGTSQFVAWNLYGPGADEILVRNQPNTGGYVYYHLDGTGNVQFLLSDHPTQPGLEKYTYDVFGTPTITGWNGETRPISAHGNRFLFTGREYLYTFRIYDYRHRIYHPGLGRFLQTDPMGLQIEGAKLSAQQTALHPAGTAPKTFSSSELNLYRYCHNDPVNKSDPLGLIQLTDAFKKQFPKSAARIESMDRRVTPQKEQAFQKWGGASPKEVNKALEPGKGPKINADPLQKAGEGSFWTGLKPKSDTLDIGEDTFRDFEKGVKGSTDTLDRVVEHELTHYFADQNNVASSKVEQGWGYEWDAYGWAPGKP